MTDGLTSLQFSTDKNLLDIDCIHSFLSESYWAKNIPRQVVTASIENSLCYGVYLQQKQIGFARVITDQATFAYLADVFVLPEFQGQGIGQQFIDYILSDERTHSVRRFLLATRDAHELYARFGFQSLSTDDARKFMQIRSAKGYS